MSKRNAVRRRLAYLEEQVDEKIEFARLKLKNGLIVKTTPYSHYTIRDPKSGSKLHVEPVRDGGWTDKRIVDIFSDNAATGSMHTKEQLAESRGGIKTINTMRRHMKHSMKHKRPKKYTTSHVVNNNLAKALVRIKDRDIKKQTKGLRRAARANKLGETQDKVYDHFTSPRGKYTPDAQTRDLKRDRLESIRRSNNRKVRREREAETGSWDRRQWRTRKDLRAWHRGGRRKYREGDSIDEISQAAREARATRLRQQQLDDAFDRRYQQRRNRLRLLLRNRVATRLRAQRLREETRRINEEGRRLANEGR